MAYLGLYENIRVRRAGFAYRQEYGAALARYLIMLKKVGEEERKGRIEEKGRGVDRERMREKGKREQRERMGEKGMGGERKRG